eukprot:sb/3468417/
MLSDMFFAKLLFVLVPFCFAFDIGLARVFAVLLLRAVLEEVEDLGGGIGFRLLMPPDATLLVAVKALLGGAGGGFSGCLVTFVGTVALMGARESMEGGPKGRFPTLEFDLASGFCLVKGGGRVGLLEEGASVEVLGEARKLYRSDPDLWRGCEVLVLAKDRVLDIPAEHLVVGSVVFFGSSVDLVEALLTGRTLVGGGTAAAAGLSVVDLRRRLAGVLWETETTPPARLSLSPMSVLYNLRIITRAKRGGRSFSFKFFKFK